jgi:hypothetical protein
MYDPGIGRWLQLDPMGFAAEVTNLYQYSGNAPTRDVDPSGCSSWEAIGVAYAPAIAQRSDSLAAPRIVFQQLRGSWIDFVAGAGTWSQPWWAGNGRATFSRPNRFRYGAIESRVGLVGDPKLDGNGGVCNTVISSEPGNAINAGSIRVLFSAFRPGTYKVKYTYYMEFQQSGNMRISANMHRAGQNEATITYESAKKGIILVSGVGEEKVGPAACLAGRSVLTVDAELTVVVPANGNARVIEIGVVMAGKKGFAAFDSAIGIKEITLVPTAKQGNEKK